MHTFQQDNTQMYTACVTSQYLANGQHCPLIYCQYNTFENTLVSASHVVHKWIILEN